MTNNLLGLQLFSLMLNNFLWIIHSQTSLSSLTIMNCTINNISCPIKVEMQDKQKLEIVLKHVSSLSLSLIRWMIA